MLLVVDANVLFSALIARGKTCDLMFSERLQLIAPEFLFMELEEHKDEFIEKSSLSNDKRLKGQPEVKVFSTADLISFLSEI